MPTRLAQSGFSGGEIGESLLGRTDLEKYSLSLRSAKNVLITKSGGIVNRAGTVFIGEVLDSTKVGRLTGFQFSTFQAYVLEWSESYARPIKDGGQILETAQNVGSVSTASQAVVTINTHGYADGDRIYGSSTIGGMTPLQSRVMVVSDQTTNTFKVKDLYGNYISSTGYTYTSGGTISRLYKFAIPYDDSELFDLNYTQTADTLYATHLSYAVRKITRTAHTTWTTTSVTFGPSLSAPGGSTATATSGSGTSTYSYKITAVDDDTGEESLPTSAASCLNDLTISGYYNTITWPSVSGAERYIVYKAESGIYGLIGGTEGTSFTDINYLPDLGDTPPASRNPFSSASAYPKVCEFHEGRLCFAQTINNPAGVWMSQSGRYTNLNVSSPAKDDDAVSFQFRPGVNPVQGLASLNDLIAFTSDAEFKVGGGGQTTYVTPASLLVRRQGGRGAAGLRPLVIGDIALFVQRQGAVIRAFGYSFEKDGYRSNDLTLLAPHLFRGHTIVDWCYQQDPDSIVWCVRDDGVLLALTFVEDQNTFAWTRVYLGGTFGSGGSATGYGVVESCCTIEGDEQDDVYFLVKRTINSTTKRYIEKLDARWIATEDSDGLATNVEDAYFVDCGVKFTSVTSTSTVTGLHHLEGQSVKAFVDGDTQGPFTVSSGQITLTSAMSANGNAQVGLAYTSDIVNLPVAQPTQTGAPQGRVISVNAVVLRMRHTRGIQYGDSRTARLYDFSAANAEDWADESIPYTGNSHPLTVDAGGTLDASILIRQSNPEPMEITMIARDVTMGGP